MPFIKEPGAPFSRAVDRDRFGRIDEDAYAAIIPGALLILRSEQDNDIETWHLTLAGQIVRACGLEQNRLYVVDSDEAYDMLKDWADDAVIAQVWTHEELAAFAAEQADIDAVMRHLDVPVFDMAELPPPVLPLAKVPDDAARDPKNWI